MKSSEKQLIEAQRKEIRRLGNDYQDLTNRFNTAIQQNEEFRGKVSDLESVVHAQADQVGRQEKELKQRYEKSVQFFEQQIAQLKKEKLEHSTAHARLAIETKLKDAIIDKMIARL